MSEKTQNRIKMTLYVVVLLLALLLEEAVFGAMHLSFVPCVMPVAVVSIALWEGMERGSMFGLVAGCLRAWSTSLSMYGAWSIVALTLTGAAAGLLTERYLLNGWKTVFSISAPAILLLDGVYVIVEAASGDLPVGAFFNQFVPACIISVFFCVLFYPLTRGVSRIGGFHG